MVSICVDGKSRISVGDYLALQTCGKGILAFIFDVCHSLSSNHVHLCRLDKIRVLVVINDYEALVPNLCQCELVVEGILLQCSYKVRTEELADYIGDDRLSRKSVLVIHIEHLTAIVLGIQDTPNERLENCGIVCREALHVEIPCRAFPWLANVFDIKVVKGWLIYGIAEHLRHWNHMSFLCGNYTQVSSDELDWVQGGCTVGKVATGSRLYLVGIFAFSYVPCYQ